LRRAAGTGTVGGVREKAGLEALKMIAVEQTLLDQQLLDSVAKPIHLIRRRDSDIVQLHAVLADVLEALPEDLRPSFVTSTTDKGYLVAVDNDLGVGLMLSEAATPGGEPWLVAAVALYRPLERPAQAEALADVTLDETLSLLNWSDSGCTWVRFAPSSGSEDSDVTMLARYSGTATPVGPRVGAWRRLVATLLQEALRAGETVLGAGEGPATRSIRLLSLGIDRPVTPADLVTAAENYRGGLDRRLREVVFVNPSESGVCVTIPFRVFRRTIPIRVLFSVSDSTDPTYGPAVNVLAGLYKPLPTAESMSWLRSFNGVGGDNEAADDQDDDWFDTTPWTFGSWVAQDAVGDQVGVFYRGRIPFYMTSMVGLDEIVRGAVREVWSTSSKYRLHEEFQEAIGEMNGTV
jgi:hypothetical protein